MIPALAPRFAALEVLSGADARVVAAQDRESGRRVVVKLAASASEEDLRALRREFRLLASLDHPSIVAARDFGVGPDGRAFFTMDEAAGPDLAAFARKHAPLEVLSAIADVAHALDRVHAVGVVHGDVKPTNVRVAGERAFLLDFGLALARGEESEGIRGTLAYTAPEVLRGARPDRRSDLYSLGLSLHEALTGVLPTAGRDLAGVLRFHFEEDVPPVSASRPDVPRKLDRILEGLLERDPAARTPSARRLLEELAEGFGIVRGATVDARPELLTPPFVGREDLLARFGASLRAAGEGRGRAIVLLGPPGAGKTRLLSTFRALAQSEGALVAEGRGAVGDRTPYRPVLEVLAALTRREGSPGAPARGVLARAARLAERETGEPGLANVSDDRSRLTLFDDVLAALEASRAREGAERPLVLLLDDVHLLDGATIAFLAFLARAAEGSRLLLTAAATEEGSGAARPLDSLLAAAGGAAWSLPPLSEPELAAAAAGALGEREIPAPYAARLLEESGGLPGRLLPVLEHDVALKVLSLGSQGLSVDLAGRARLVPAGTPAALHEARLTALAPERRSLLAALAIAPSGAGFDLARRLGAAVFVPSALASSDDALADDLDSLTSASLLLRRDRSGEETTWEVASPELRAFLEASLPDAVRRRLHDAAASAYEARLAARPDLVSVAAAHALEGTDDERAVRLGLTAAARAERLFANEPAAALYNAVLPRLDVEGREDERLQVRERLADVHARAGEWRRALTSYHVALKELAGRDDVEPRERRRRLALLSFKAGRIRLLRGDVETARTLFDRAEDDLTEVGSPEERILVLDAAARTRLLRSDVEGAARKANAAFALAPEGAGAEIRSVLFGTLGAVAVAQREWAAAEDHLRASADEARRADREDLAREAQAALARLLGKTGRVAESESLVEAGAREAERSRDPRALAEASLSLGEARAARGDFPAARGHFEKALDLGRRLGARGTQAAAHLGLGLCDERSGRFDDGETNYRLVLDLLGEGVEGVPGVRARVALASLLRKRGDAGKAETVIREAFDGAHASGDRETLALTRLALALVERDREQYDDARRHLDQAAAELEGPGTTPLLLRVLFASADLALRTGEPERAAEDAARASELARTLDDRFEAARVLTLEARLLHADGRRAEAEQAFETGTGDLSALGCLYDLGKAYYEWGLRTDERARAASRLGTAARLFERIGARRELERTRGVLERLATKARSEPSAGGALAEGVIGLYEVSRIVNSTRDLGSVLDETVDLALKRLNAERGMILLLDPVTGRLAVRVARNLKTGREEEAEAISRSVVDRVVHEGRSLLAADARVDPRFEGRESILAHSIVSFLCVPLRVRERVSGAIYVDHRASARLFGESDRAFLEAFADLAAVAIENARLVEELLEARLRLSVENESLKAGLTKSGNLDALVGSSDAARRVKATLPRAAAGAATVLVRGESGTGKNLVARILHALSPRREGPFIQFNCAALPETLAESELFGHEKGSFTGADRRKPGRFELAHGGTIFLDEIGKTSLAIQAKLLRVVEDKEFERVGGTQTLKADVKIVAATNLDLESAIATGTFREDLYYRLNVVPIELPPLRKRLGDLPVLVEHFVTKLSRDLGAEPRRVTPETLDLFARYAWPGNVRELEATLHRALVLSSGDQLRPEDFPWIAGASLAPVRPEAGNRRVETATAPAPVVAEGPLDPDGYERTLADVDRRLVERALEESGGRIREAARRLGLARNTLKAKMVRYHLRGTDESAN